MSGIRRKAIDEGLRIYSKVELDDPDESPLEIAIAVAVDMALGGAVGTLEALEDALLRHFSGAVPAPEDDAVMMAAQRRARGRKWGLLHREGPDG